jgi:MFS family permease
VAASNVQAPARLLTPQFLALLAAHGTLGLTNSVYFLFPKYLQVEFEADPTLIGLMTGAPWITMVLCVPFTGTMVDRLGRRRFLVIGSLLFALGCAILANTHAIGATMFFARVVQGIGFSFFLISASTLAADLAPPSRLSQALGLFGATIVITNALSPAIAEPLAAASGWTSVFWATCGTACLGALLTTRLAPGPKRAPGAGASFTTVLKDSSLRLLWVAAGLAGILFGAVLTFSSPWALNSGVQNVSGFFFAYAIAAALIRVTLGGLADRVGHLRVAAGAMALYTLCPLVLIPVATIGLYVPGVAIGIAHGLYYPSLNALAINLGDDRARGTVMALFNGSFNVGFSLGSLGLGLVAATIGYPGMFASSSVAGVLCLGLLITMARRLTR